MDTETIRHFSFKNEEEWLNWRSSRICASDFPIILGHSPYKNAYELFLEKTSRKAGFVSSRNRSLFDAAKDAELIIFQRLMDELLEKEPELFGVDEECEHAQFCIGNEHYGASLDFVYGIPTKPRFAVEVKTVQSLDGQIPLHFRSQCTFQRYLLEKYALQHQAKIEKFFLVKARLADIEADPINFPIEYFEGFKPKEGERLESLVAPFLEAIQHQDFSFFGLPIPKAEDPKFYSLPKLSSAESDYLKAEAAFKEAKHALDRAKEALLDELDDEKNYSGKLLEVRRVISKGRVLYDQIPELATVLLDKYRGDRLVKTTIFNKSRNMV